MITGTYIKFKAMYRNKYRIETSSKRVQAKSNRVSNK